MSLIRIAYFILNIDLAVLKDIYGTYAFFRVEFTARMEYL